MTLKSFDELKSTNFPRRVLSALHKPYRGELRESRGMVSRIYQDGTQTPYNGRVRVDYYRA